MLLFHIIIIAGVLETLHANLLRAARPELRHVLSSYPVPAALLWRNLITDLVPLRETAEIHIQALPAQSPLLSQSNRVQGRQGACVNRTGE